MDEKTVWDKGDAYEAYVGRWSRPVAREFLRWLNVPADASWLDVGCGTGALSDIILTHTRPKAVRGIDPSPGFVAKARQQVSDTRASFSVGDARHIDAAESSADVVVSGLVLNFIPDVTLGMQEMVRVVKPGGVVAAYVWDYAGKMEFMRYFWDAAAALKPQDRAHDEGVRFPLCQPEPLKALFVQAGLQTVEVRAIDVATPFRDFDDFWLPFLGGQFPAPDYAVSLDEVDRAALRDRLRASLPIADDGSIPLMARAWAVRGIRQPA